MEMVSWQQRSPRASVGHDAGRASLGSAVTAVEGGAGTWCGLLPQDVVFPDGQLTIFQMPNLGNDRTWGFFVMRANATQRTFFFFFKSSPKRCYWKNLRITTKDEQDSL